MSTRKAVFASAGCRVEAGVMSAFQVSYEGFCPVCEAQVTFSATREGELSDRWYPHWFRGSLHCSKCRSIPRERALALVLAEICPDWRVRSIHECSPGGWALSAKLKRECAGYVPSNYAPEVPAGTCHPAGWRSEDLENQTFEDEAFDLVITQDVFEHLFHPGRAAAEIRRTLKPGGLCISTVPIADWGGQSSARASLINGQVVYHQPAQYHGNPVGDGKALVTIDWGADIGAYLSHHGGMPFYVMRIDDMHVGVRDPHNAVLVGRKQSLPEF